MDSGKYIDFKGEKPNTFYTFDVDEETGDVKFIKTVAEYAIAGDSDSGYFSLPKEALTYPDDQDHLVETADFVAGEINNSFQYLLMNVFNVPEERKKTIRSTREVVSDAALFLSKKRYYMRVIDDEGQRGISYKAKGLEIIKSDTPEVLKEFLKEMVHMILDGDDVDAINKAIREFKREYMHMDIRQIARPISCKGLKKYEGKENAVEFDEKSGKNKKVTIPYQVKAALEYNSMCSPRDRKILAGEKVYIFYVKGMKTTSLAIPIEANELPSFIDDVVVDYEAMWEKNAYKKIVNYLSSIGYDIESRKRDAVKTLFNF